jgi:hypothetical protein
MNSPTIKPKSESMLTSEDLYNWLNAWPTVSSQLKLVVVGLRRRQLSGSHPCAKASIEILRSLLGTCKFNSTYQMIIAVKVKNIHLSLTSRILFKQLDVTDFLFFLTNACNVYIIIC